MNTLQLSLKEFTEHEVGGIDMFDTKVADEITFCQ